MSGLKLAPAPSEQKQEEERKNLKALEKTKALGEVMELGWLTGRTESWKCFAEFRRKIIREQLGIDSGDYKEASEEFIKAGAQLGLLIGNSLNESRTRLQDNFSEDAYQKAIIEGFKYQTKKPLCYCARLFR